MHVPENLDNFIGSWIQASQVRLFAWMEWARLSQHLHVARYLLFFFSVFFFFFFFFV